MQIDLRFLPAPYEGIYQSGDSVRILVTFLGDGASPIAVTGPQIEIEAPGVASPVVYPEASLTADGVGRWYLDTVAGAEGYWRVTASCTGPTPASRLLRFVVAATGGAGRLPPVVTTADLGPVVTQRGGMLTGVRVSHMEPASILAPDALVYAVIGGADRAIPASAFGASQTTVTQLGAGAVARTVQGKLRDSVSPMDFGAIGDGVANDTAAMQAAVDAIRGTGLWLDGGGKTYKVCVLPTTLHTFGNSPTTPVYGAVHLGTGGVRLRNMRTVLGFTAGIPAGSLSYMFASDKNVTLGTVAGVVFDDVAWDISNAFGNVQQNPRAVYIIGGVQIVFLNCFQTSSGARNSCTITLQNCDGVRVAGHRQKNTTQGFSWSYIQNWSMTDCAFDNFSEAIDFDRVITDGVATNIRFRNGLSGGLRRGQCWDLNSVARVVISNVTAEDAGNVFIANFKTTSWPTFAEYIYYTAGEYNPDLRNVLASDITIQGVRARRIGLDGGGGVALSIGNDRTTGAEYIGQPVIKAITMEDVYFEDTNGVIIWEGEDIILRRFRLNGVIGVDSNSFAALTIMQQQDSPQVTMDSKLSIVMEDIEINNAGGIAMLVNAPTKATIRRVKVSGYNIANGAQSAYGVWLRGLDVKNADITMEDIAVSGGSVVVAPNDLRIQDNGTANYRVRMAGEFKLAGPTPLQISRIETLRVAKQVSLGAVDARSFQVVSLDDAADTLDVTASDYIQAPLGARVTMRNVGGALPTNISTSGIYGLRKLATPALQLTSSPATPFAGGTRTFAGVGTGTHFINLTRVAVVHTAQGVEKFLGLRLIAGSAFVADASNTAVLAIRRMRAGAQVTITTSAISASAADGAIFYTTPVAFGTPANADLIAGDLIVLEVIGSAGAGVYFPGVTAEVYVLRRE